MVVSVAYNDDKVDLFVAFDDLQNNDHKVITSKVENN